MVLPKLLPFGVIASQAECRGGSRSEIATITWRATRVQPNGGEWYSAKGSIGIFRCQTNSSMRHRPTSHARTGKPYAHPGHQNVAHRCLELQTRTNVEPWLSVAGPENRLSMGSDPVRLSKVGNHAKSNRRKKRRRPVVRNQREELMIRNSLTSLEGCTVRSVQLWSQR